MLVGSGVEVVVGIIVAVGVISLDSVGEKTGETVEF
jgi:hypothetical protein